MIRIGKIVATHGLAGTVVFSHFAGSNNWLKKGDALFIELNKGSYIPYFVEHEKAANEEEYLLGFEEVDTVEAAKKLVGKHVYVKEDLLKKEAQNSPLLWIGFNIVDTALGSVGIIEDVFQIGHQWLAKITYQEREVLIPLIEQMLIEVSVRNKFIRMDLPEGLLEL